MEGATGETRLAPTFVQSESAQADFAANGHSEGTVANSFAGQCATGETRLAPTLVPGERGMPIATNLCHAGLRASAQADDVAQPSAAISIARPRVLLIDTGFKHNIARCLAERDLQVTLAPHDVDLAFVREFDPDGVLLSNGPGDPENVAHLIEIVRWALAERTPLMGICLGHQVLGLAIGATTSRLPFGHHGSNHPVREDPHGARHAHLAEPQLPGGRRVDPGARAASTSAT